MHWSACEAFHNLKINLNLEDNQSQPTSFRAENMIVLTKIKLCVNDPNQLGGIAHDQSEKQVFFEYPVIKDTKGDPTKPDIHKLYKDLD